MPSTTDWAGPVLKKYVDESLFNEQAVSDYPTLEHPAIDAPISRQEARALEDTGKSERFVTAPDDTKYLRITRLKSDEVLDEYQVFIEQTNDGRENDTVHFGEGQTQDEAREDISIPDSSTLTHIGSVREYFETASELSFSLQSGTMVPEDLLGYKNAISNAYQQVNNDT